MIDKKDVFLLPNSIDYELLDCGNHRKLERFGKLILDRPEVEAKWKPRLPKSDWQKADWHFYEERGKKGKWTNNTGAPSEWKITYQHKNVQFQFELRLTAFKHLGIFPEQAENWKFIQEILSLIPDEKKVLNLFAYTGIASIVAAKCGAKVTNVDSVKQVLNWGRSNADCNGVENIRWILEDARKFVEKSLRRGDKYHGIIMDPPAFGYGSKNEIWKIEKDLKLLLEQSIQLLNHEPSFFILNTYSPKLPLENLLNMIRLIPSFPEKFSAGNLSLKSAQEQRLPLGNLIRFTK